MFSHCRDGSDEPGTSACPNGRFHCLNKGHKPLDILSSRVNDGICDCCDGSDEWDSRATCSDTCKEMGEKAAQEQRRLQELHEQGNQKRLEYVAQGREKVEEARRKLAEKEPELETLQSEVDALRTAKEAAEEPEKAAKDEHRQRWEEEKEKRKEAKRVEAANIGFQELDTNSDGYVSVEELRARVELDDDKDGEVSEAEALEYLDNQQSVNFDTFLANIWDVVADKCTFKKPAAKEDEEGVAEDGDGAPAPEGADENAPGDIDDDDDDDDFDDDDDDDDDDTTPGDNEEKMPEYDEATKALIATADEARAALRDAESKRNALESEIGELKKLVEMDFGHEYEFGPLYRQCYEFTDREYTYKMCAFDKVTQRSKNGGRETNLGTWGTWSGSGDKRYFIMKYENGEKCWNGPSRSATITLKCGLEDTLLSASEPNRCEYAMEFSTPAVCEPLKHIIHEEL